MGADNSRDLSSSNAWIHSLCQLNVFRPCKCVYALCLHVLTLAVNTVYTAVDRRLSYTLVYN